MSALTDERVAEEFRRRFQHYDGYESEARQADLLRVFAAGVQVTEAATRAAVAAEIRELEHTREQAQHAVRMGRSVDYCEGYDIGIFDAARIAEGRT